MTGGEAYFSDYLIWMDADAVPLNMSLRLEQLAAAHPQAHILASKDSSSMINTGVMIIKNSEWALKFLRDWRGMKDGLYHGDIMLSPAATDQAGFAAAFLYTKVRRRQAKFHPAGEARSNSLNFMSSTVSCLHFLDRNRLIAFFTLLPKAMLSGLL